MKTNRVAGRHQIYLMVCHVSTFNDHLMFPLVGLTRCRTVPQSNEMLPVAFLDVDSKKG